MRPRRPAALKAAVVVGAACAAALCLVVADFVVSLFWRPALHGVTIQKPYIAKDNGWYELQPNFAGHDQFGPYVYPVETDSQGFRRKPGALPAPAYDVIFLGDSFTYGMNGPWEDTFVGMYADDTSKAVLNAGVSSYSPTAYLHQYKRALAAHLLRRGHTVVVAIDVSDVQDEAGIWIDGEQHPEKVAPAAPVAPVTPLTPVPGSVDIRAAMIDALPNTWAVYHFVRYGLLGWNRAELIEHPRSAFTYQDWAKLDAGPALQQQGYAPLGVAGGLRRVEEKLLAIVQAARPFDARVYFLIYPWPAQVANADRFSWSSFIGDVCRRGACAGVIDTIAVFRALAARDRGWLNAYYVGGDTHFTTRGNRVIADVVMATIDGQALSPLRWGGDAEGGAPFVEADPADPNKLVGFDVEIAELIAKQLGRTPQFVQVQFTSLDQSARRGDFDIGLSGIEDIPARRQSLAASIPYFEFREVLTVREADRDRYRTLADLTGRRVATLGGTMAYDLLLAAERTHGITAVSYDDDVHPYSDLALGRVDGVVLDNVLADRAMRRNAGLYTHADALAVGHYIVITAPQNTALRDQVDQILKAAMRDGTLERIFRKWNVWNDDQPALFARALDMQSGQSSDEAAPSRMELTWRYLPSLFRAAVITLVLSFAAMALAVALGMSIAIGRIYGDPFTKLILTVYVEVMRGTPVLLQLFVIYYGLASVIRLPAFVAALLGLGLNYAAYESEIYRSALEAVPKGQLDAARILGFTRLQTLRLIRAPQAFRIALAPMTNDFVALLKDSSLVSMLTVVELTKQTQIFATNIGSWVIPGILCALLYLAMSLPLGYLARRLEERWRMPTV